MIKLAIDRSNIHATCVLGFSSLEGLKIVVSVKRQFKYWSNRAISTCFGLHVLTAEKANRHSRLCNERRCCHGGKNDAA